MRVYLIHADRLDPSRSFAREDRRRVLQARRAGLLADLESAMAEHDIYKIDLAGKRAVEEGCQLSEIAHEAVQRARRSIVALEALKLALESDDDARIVDAYDAELLDDCQHVTGAQRQRVELARGRMQRWQPLRHALLRQDDVTIAALYDRALFLGFVPLTQEQRARCELAVQRVDAYERLREALRSNDPYKVLMAYDEEMLAQAALLTTAERQRIEAARYQVILLKACKSGDAVRMADAYRVLAAARVTVPEGVDMDAVLSATRHIDLLEAFRRSLEAVDRNDEEIVRLGERLAEMWPDLLTEAERQQIRRSKVRWGARLRLQAATTSGDNLRVSIVLQHLIALEESGGIELHDETDGVVVTHAPAES